MIDEETNETRFGGKKFAQRIVHCIEESIGNRLKEDIFSQGLRTQNSTPFRTWDHMNTLLYTQMPELSCIADTTKRGWWQLVPIYNPETHCVYTIMREERFLELQGTRYQRKPVHYLDCFATVLNSKLVTSNIQMSLFPDETPNESQCAVVEQILADLSIPEADVKNHVLVLFRASGFTLQKVRAVIINGSLQIIEEVNWSGFIAHDDSIIMDTVDDVKADYNQPAGGLALTQKANLRLNKGLRVAEETNQNSKKA